MDEPEGQPAAVDEPEEKPATVYRPTDEEAAVEVTPGAAGVGWPLVAAPGMRRRSSKWVTVAMAVLVTLGLFHPGKVGGFVAYNCPNATNQVNVYSLLEPAACPSVTPHQEELTGT